MTIVIEEIKVETEIGTIMTRNEIEKDTGHTLKSQLRRLFKINSIATSNITICYHERHCITYYYK